MDDRKNSAAKFSTDAPYDVVLIRRYRARLVSVTKDSSGTGDCLYTFNYPQNEKVSVISPRRTRIIL